MAAKKKAKRTKKQTKKKQQKKCAPDVEEQSDSPETLNGEESLKRMEEERGKACLLNQA